MLSSSSSVFIQLCLLLFLHFSSLQIFSLSESDYTPPDKYFIACGSKTNITTKDSRTFIGDRTKKPSFFLSTGQSKPIINTDETLNDMSFLYKTARVFKTPSSYELEVDKKGTYMVRLHFYSFPSEFNLSQAVFDVVASGYSLLSNFSVRKSSDRPIEEFILPVKKERFKLYFHPLKNSPLAFVNAIEVFLVPEEDLLPNSAQLITSDGEKGNQSNLVSLVYRTIHRINVGGDNITSESDLLWRTWLEDDGFLINPKATKKSEYYDGKLNFLSGGSTKYSAPEYVYKTGRELNVEANFSKATWAFPVSKTAMKYLVRVHLCDIIGKGLSVFDFSLFVYNKFIKTIDAFDEIGNLQSPFHLDYVVDTNGSGFINISIGLGPSNNWSNVPNAYLNGVEIFEIEKISSLVIPLESPHKKNQNGLVVGSGSCVGFLIIIGILIIALMVLRSRKAKSKRNSSEFLYGGMSLADHDIPNASNLQLRLKKSFAEIKRATDNFDEKKLVGEGGFGKVYKGTLKEKEEHIEVAVKRSQPGHGQGVTEFHTEVLVLSELRHRHLVSLIGTSQYTVKSDVYSFGVVLLEILCAKPAIFSQPKEENVSLAKWGMEYYRNGQLEKIIDPSLSSEIDTASLRVVGDIAEKCLKENGSERPTMDGVVWALRYALQLHQIASRREGFEDTFTTNSSLETLFPSVHHMPTNAFPVEIDDDDDDASMYGDIYSNTFSTQFSTTNEL
ncbi:hypothetical protein G4B88_006856 [Cannabis sativa]|uniref:Protein kinase domain-containing protein n=1 Tax=Cannabis sativa TaxID=3483 RepID=A0A7J6G3P6_CANSA|nr:hypothetical protein G4B88_006856 [Cannabis sativa]